VSRQQKKCNGGLFRFHDDSISGSFLKRRPVALKMALESAGATGGTPGSPTPAGAADEATSSTDIAGLSFILMTR
jgi:hypothetical protein